jgi:NDP-sugar pyrophosphorylase family protein
VSYGDTLAKINFKDLINKHKKSKCLLTIVVAPIQNPFGLVTWNTKNKVTSFKEKPILNHYIGYAVFSPKLFSIIQNGIVNLKDGKGIIECIKYLIKKKQVNSYKLENLQITINSPEELKYARLNYKKYFTF